MQAAPGQPAIHRRSIGRNIGFMLIPPLAVLILGTVLLAVLVTSYESRHNGRIYTGVSVAGVDLSGLTPTEAAGQLQNRLTYPQQSEIRFIDPHSGTTWAKTPQELGFSLDVAQSVDQAYAIGREGSAWQKAQAMFRSWYYGAELSPTYVLEEAKLDQAVTELATAIFQPPVNAEIDFSGDAPDFAAGAAGQALDVTDLRERISRPLTQFRAANIELLVREIDPALFDASSVAGDLNQLLSGGVTFYLPQPLDELDLMPVSLEQAQLSQWVRVTYETGGDGTLSHQLFVDENALRHWLSQYEDELYRDPVRARYYFDDDTRELVLIAPHVNGRELDIDATIAAFNEQVLTANRSIPFVVRDIIPEASSSATAADLGITELITETTTWFFGSSDERKHNIANAASNFHGIVIAPYEEFSFNKYLGSISEADGYTEGLIIVNGQTIEGIGGGICQVSTTLYQTAFFSGFPITERLEHGYMLGYYRDGAGHGMDATIYSPIVDMKFLNNTPYYLLMENYYSTENEALTFKFYSTSMGRTVAKSDPAFENVTEIPSAAEDRWVYRENLEPGTVEQVDWATEGADVFVQRTVYNADGQIIEDRVFESNYIPVPNVFHYGPGVEPYDYSLVPPDDK